MWILLALVSATPPQAAGGPAPASPLGGAPAAGQEVSFEPGDVSKSSGVAFTLKCDGPADVRVTDGERVMVWRRVEAGEVSIPWWQFRRSGRWTAPTHVRVKARKGACEVTNFRLVEGTFSIVEPMDALVKRAGLKRTKETPLVRIATNESAVDLEKLASEIERFWKLACEELRLANPKHEWTATLVLFEKPEEYRKFVVDTARDVFAAGADEPKAQGFTFERTSATSCLGATLRPVFFHELMHQWATDVLELPVMSSWQQEGVCYHLQNRFLPQEGLAAEVRKLRPRPFRGFVPNDGPGNLQAMLMAEYVIAKRKPWTELPDETDWRKFVDERWPDVVIRGAKIADGTGGAAVVGDVAITGERIVGVGTLDVRAARVIDGKGLVVAPGFIDLHTHSDDTILAEEGRRNWSYVTQGVTTIVTGNCGGGHTDVAKFFAKLEKQGAAANVIHLIPHGDVRKLVMGNDDREPTAEELAKMKAIVERERKAGAWGMSTGLIYTPGTFAKTAELVELAKPAGWYVSHIRGEGTDLLDSIREALEIGEKAGVPVHISHLKASGRKAWGKVHDACAMIEDARKKGRIVTADQYPYIASSTSLGAMVVPARARTDGSKLEDARKEIEEALERRGADTIRIASYSKRKEWNGKSLAEIAKSEGKSAADIVIEIQKNGGASCVSFGMCEEDVAYVMKHPWVATASDGSAKTPGDTVPHPRSYGTFPRKFARYGLSTEFAVRSSSGLPADILGLTDRGYVRVGAFADLVIFDPAEFQDHSTYEKPHQWSTGVKHLFVNGRLVCEDGKFTGALPGRPIYRK